METNLHGKRALVTGSTSGIGLGIATELAGSGCDIVLSGFGEPAAIHELQMSLRNEYGVRALHLEANVAKPEECRSLAVRALAEFGEIDILVNNAGIQHVAPLEEFAEDRWDAILAVNLSAAFHLSAAVLAGMRQRGYGRILNIASVHGLVGSKFKAAYVAAKHGLIGLTKVTALETAGQGITCNAICPGWVLTPLVEAQVTARMKQEGLERRQAEQLLLSEKQPSGKFATPQEIGALAVFLCSDAAANITGASLPVDGGWTAQ
jgi:3-hydroxybutyrate dehydrogenase